MWKICDFIIEVKPQRLLPAELVSLVVLKMVPLLHAQISFLCESSRKLNSKVTCIGFDGRTVSHDSYSSISVFTHSVTDFPPVRNCRTSPVQLLHVRFLAAQGRRFSCTLSHAAPSLVKLHKNRSNTSQDSPHWKKNWWGGSKFCYCSAGDRNYCLPLSLSS